ncbi:MAG: sigma 54-interacting transcriptional regulator [Bacteriovoracales bacterium]|nr:sigma 54-interacting transcriptional regulator [Bacteriovoracales bacterium]
MQSSKLKSLKALVIENDPYILEELTAHYSRFAGTVEQADSVQSALARLKNNRYDIVSIDLNLTDDGDTHRDGLKLLPMAKRQGAFCFILSAYKDKDTIKEVSSVDSGTIYIKKGSLYGPTGIIERVFNEYIGRSIIMHFCSPLEKMFKNKVATQNVELQEKLRDIFKAALYNQNIMLFGEVGVGKDYFANILADAIHEVEKKIYGDKVKKNFHKIELSTLDPNEMEKILFGSLYICEETGEGEGDLGVFDRANGGILFLDEIESIPLALQNKLLSALSPDEDGFYTFKRIGNSDTLRKSSFLLITGSSVDLERMLEEGTLKESFYHRIAPSTPLEIPPLRERPEDIEKLIHFFLERSPMAMTISDETLTSLIEYQWPGNISQLERVIEELSKGSRSKIKKLDLPTYIINKEHPLLSKKMERFYTKAVKKFIQTNGLKDYFRQIEKIAFKDAMIDTDHKISKAADSLGIGRAKAYTIMEKIGGMSALSEGEQ